MHQTLTIRPAKPDDVQTIAEIHVRSWQETYAGQMPHDFLDNLSIENRQKQWQSFFDNLGQNPNFLYLAILDEKIIGFVSFGHRRDIKFHNSGEIYAIYILRDFQGQGIGKSLFETAKKILAESGYSNFYLWVLNTNTKTIDIYKKLGGQVREDIFIEDKIGDMPCREINVSFKLSENPTL